jgi:penicillin amidase
VSRRRPARPNLDPVLLLLLIFFSNSLTPSAAPGAEGRSIPTRVHEVEGLSSEVEILIDRWGVPHIYASKLYDVFFAQGFNAARDRLWQLDLWKRRGDGTLSEVFGESFVEKDRAARLFLFRGDMRAEWLAYASDTKRIVSSFVAGVNAYIQLSRKEPRLLPFEFDLLDYRPATWTPESVVRIRSHGLLWNVVSEASRAKFVRDHGKEALEFRELLQPAHEVEIPEGLDLAEIPDDVLKVYDLATSGVSFERNPNGELVLSGHPPVSSVRGGSNNWVVAPSRSSSGRPILANDPHRAISVPSLRYIAHLSAPGLDVIGAGEPALPGISIGHNRRAAFGLTIFYIDQEDLYVYRTRPGKPEEYWYRGRWEPMQVVTERIPVRGAEPVEAELKFTRHGPVVYEDPRRRLAIGVRAAWLEPGMSPYLGSIESMRSQNWDQFLAAMNRWGLPPENLVYADVDGDIGWKPGGLAPIRPNWDGLLPVPGDGRYEWAGFRNADELPVEHNPTRGWIATANHMNLPSGYPHALGFEWVLPYRYQRIRQALQPRQQLTLEDMRKLQIDYQSVSARRVVALLEGLSSPDAGVQRALKMLRGWNGSLDPSSAPAALYEIWFHRHLVHALMANWVEDPRILQAVLSDDDLDPFEAGNVELWISRLEAPESWRGADPLQARNGALLSSLAAAIEEVERLLGNDWDDWSWGRLHKAEMRHPLSALLEEDERAKVDVGPAARGGSGATVNNTWYGLRDLVQLYGASFRMVLDVGNWDDSTAMNSPGQSGDPSSPHYRDLFDAWAGDESFPLLYGRDRIEAATEQRILLRPGSR